VKDLQVCNSLLECIGLQVCKGLHVGTSILQVFKGQQGSCCSGGNTTYRGMRAWSSNSSKNSPQQILNAGVQ
jgi:hypothetical protein